MESTVDEREALWDDFLTRWPLEKLVNMGLNEYSQAGDKDNFCYWVESKTEKLGSIWGGSAFKFGVFSRDDKSSKPNDRTRCYRTDYAWIAKYGNIPEQAFENVKKEIITVANAARDGRLKEVDKANLGQAFKWKLAFLYQNRNAPCVIPIFKSGLLRLMLDTTENKVSALQRELMKKVGSKGVFKYGDEAWISIQTKLSSELIPSEAQRYFEESEQFSLIKSATQKIAGYESREGKQLALALDNKKTTLYLKEGAWLKEIEAQLEGVTHYAANKARSSNLAANAPQLALGNPIVKVVVPRLDALVALCDAYDDIERGELLISQPLHNQPNLMPPVNLILYGPPGTGKTYETINEALKILDPVFLNKNLDKRFPLKQRFDELAQKEKRLRFVTFHQSFSYEDFVEGIRAVSNDDKEVEYTVESGIFKRLCDDARTNSVRADTGIRSTPCIWKISIDGSGNTPTKTYCLEHGEARIGWGKTGDLRQMSEDNDYYRSLGSSDRSTLRHFAYGIVPGDILLCIQSVENIGGVGVVSGDYRYEEELPAPVRATYNHVLPVKWLYRNLKLSILPLNEGKQFTLKTVYPIERFTWGDLLAYLEKSGVKPMESSRLVDERKPHVLIIDEINRGNISRIFGELITLIEPSKREGENEALSVDLPYSKKPFSVPSNVYLIGTMNTADRSLASLDIALRRRFIFKEMQPQPDLLKEVNVDGINIGQLLRVMNERIEVLLDRDHCLGHAYFIEMKDRKDKQTLDQLAFIFRHNILPLLQEYFFEDWERIRWVLNDHNCPADVEPFIREPNQNRDLEQMFGPDVATTLRITRWELNEAAFSSINSYKNIVGNNSQE